MNTLTWYGKAGVETPVVTCERHRVAEHERRIEAGFGISSPSRQVEEGCDLCRREREKLAVPAPLLVGTPAETARLQKVMDDVCTREIKHVVIDGTPEEVAQHVTDLAAIYTCIATAHDLLSGQAFKRLGEAITGVAVREARK
jgi:hypothetical protein